MRYTTKLVSSIVNPGDTKIGNQGDFLISEEYVLVQKHHGVFGYYSKISRKITHLYKRD